MELSRDFVLELLGMETDNCSTYPNEVGMNEFYTDGWSCDFYPESLDSCMASGFSRQLMEPSFEVPFSEVYSTLDASSFTASATLVADHITAPYDLNNVMPQAQDHYRLMMDDKVRFLANGIQDMEEDKYASGCKVEMVQCPTENQGLEPDKSVVTGEGRRNGVKKVGGQPSKNLMAERRRRKRLNDRLSMLRSIVPRISKMDRTSILADTIGYMKELLEKIGKLEKDLEEQQTEADVIKSLKKLKSNEQQTKNSTKFEVKVGEKDTRVNMCCTPGPGSFLISTVSALEELGLEIEQCVVSCFNDFSMQAACSQVSKELGAEEIKQALLKNAGYDGRCISQTTQAE